MTSSVKTDDFYKMLAEFDMQNLVLELGWFGTEPRGTQNFLTSRNIDYDVMYNEIDEDALFKQRMPKESKDGDIFIYTFWNKSNPPFDGAHTIAVTQGIDKEAKILAHEFSNTHDTKFASWKELFLECGRTMACYRLYQ